VAIADLPMMKSASGTRLDGLGTYALAKETGFRERSSTRWMSARIAEACLGGNAGRAIRDRLQIVPF